MVKAVLFDLDGVIIDTERHGHRVAFNRAFAELGRPNVVWDEDFYHTLLQIGGGKERIRHYFEKYSKDAPQPDDMDAFIAAMHRRKTDIFVQMLPELPLRPGVRRFMREIKGCGVPMGICTTSNERVAATVAEKILPEIPFAVILAGDSVKRKKPDPEIYLAASAALRAPPGACLVVEDSSIGVRAAKAAGCRVLATYNGYTEAEDLDAADFIVNCLGDADGEKAIAKKQLFPVIEDGEVRFSLLATGS